MESSLHQKISARQNALRCRRQNVLIYLCDEQDRLQIPEDIKRDARWYWASWNLIKIKLWFIPVCVCNISGRHRGASSHWGGDLPFHQDICCVLCRHKKRKEKKVPLTQHFNGMFVEGNQESPMGNFLGTIAAWIEMALYGEKYYTWLIVEHGSQVGSDTYGSVLHSLIRSQKKQRSMYVWWSGNDCDSVFTSASQSVHTDSKV